MVIKGLVIIAAVVLDQVQQRMHRRFALQMRGRLGGDMAKPFRGAVIGCGFFARNHLHAWREIPEAEIVAVCDIDAGRAEAMRADFAVPRAYADADMLFAQEQLDFVDIVTTMASHRSLVELAARHGVPTIVQKPLAPSWEDCLAIVRAAEAAGVPLMVHENFRFQAPMRAIRDVLASGRLGPLHFGRISFRSGHDVYANQPYLAREERFIILDLGIHLLDLARVFLGEVVNLDCVTQRVNAAIAGEDVATTLMRHASGATSLVDMSYATRQAREPFPETFVRLEGRDGTVELGDDYRLTSVTGGRVEETSVAPPLRPWAARPWHALQDSVYHAERHFIDALAAGRMPETSGADNLKTYALVLAAYESAARGAPVAPRGR
jgi:D-apiose dehydrogenase